MKPAIERECHQAPRNYPWVKTLSTLKIRTLMLVKSMTQVDLARITGKSVSTINRTIIGETKREDVRRAIVQALQPTVEDLWGENEKG